MPGATPNRAYPYPLPADPVNVPADIQALAEAVDNDVQANLESVTNINRVFGHMGSSGVQTVQSGTETPLNYQIQYLDNDNMVNVVSAPTQLSINTAGFYMFHTLVTVPVTNWTNLVLRMKLNTTTEVFNCDQEFQSGAQSRFEYTAVWMYPMTVGDTMSVTIQHNGTGPLWVLNRQLFGVRMAT
jgi:hypothetical protein